MPARTQLATPASSAVHFERMNNWRARLRTSLSVIAYALASVALFVLALFLAAVSLWGCGYSETDMQLQRDRVEQLERLLDKCEALARSSTARARECTR